jgi:hypothetical protein
MALFSLDEFIYDEIYGILISNIQKTVSDRDMADSSHALEAITMDYH